MNAPQRAGLLVAVIGASILLTACTWRREEPPPVAAPGFAVRQARVALGSPVEITYRFVVAPDAPPFGEDYRVFVHFLDSDDELMWTDDHNPPTPTTQWKPGETVEYTRTMFVPVYPYLGDRLGRDGAVLGVDVDATAVERRRSRAAVVQGRETRTAAADRERVPHLQGRLAPASRSPRTTRPSSGSGRRRTPRWRSEPEAGRRSLPAPRQPGRRVRGAPQVQVTLGAQALDTFTIHPSEERDPPDSDHCGGSSARPTWSISASTWTRRSCPPWCPGGKNTDPRELGVRVFHAFVEPQGTPQANPRPPRGPPLHVVPIPVLDWVVMIPRMLGVAVGAALCLACAAPASAEIVFFASGRSLSVSGHRVDGETIVLILRGGGEMACDRAARGADCPRRGAVSRTGRRRRGRPAGARPASGTYAGHRSSACPPSRGWMRASCRRSSRSSPATSREARSPKGAMGLMQLMPADGAPVRRRQPVRSAREHRRRRPAPELAARPVRPPARPGRLQRRRGGRPALRGHAPLPAKRATTCPASCRCSGLADPPGVRQAVPRLRPSKKAWPRRPPRRPQREGGIIRESPNADNLRRDNPLRWNSAVGSSRPRARSSRASTSPRARRGCATSSRTRGCTSCRCGARGWPEPGCPPCRGGSGSPSHEFLVFNQELATLLKAGMPLVQSLDLLRQRVTNPLFKDVLDDVSREGAGRHGAVGRVRRARRSVSARLHRVAAGRRAQRQPRRGAAPLRRVREGHRRGAGGRRSPPSSTRRSSSSLALVLVGIIVLGSCRRSRTSTRASARELPLSTRIIVAVSDFVLAQFPLLLAGLALAAAAVADLGAAAGTAGAIRSGAARGCRGSGRSSRKFATSQLARTLATLLGGGIPLVQRARHRGPVDRQPVHGAANWTRSSQRVREGAGASRPRCAARGMLPDVAVKMVGGRASRPARCRRC